MYPQSAMMLPSVYVTPNLAPLLSLEISASVD